MDQLLEFPIELEFLNNFALNPNFTWINIESNWGETGPTYKSHDLSLILLLLTFTKFCLWLI